MPVSNRKICQIISRFFAQIQHANDEKEISTDVNNTCTFFVIFRPIKVKHLTETANMGEFFHHS